MLILAAGLTQHQALDQTQDNSAIQCDTVETKLHEADGGPEEVAEHAECWQEIQINFGFMVQKSSVKTKKAPCQLSTAHRAHQACCTVAELQP